MDVAEWFGVSLPAVDGWIRRGCPHVQRGSKGTPWVFDLLQVAEWRFGKPDSMNDGVPFDPESPDTHPKDRKDWYEGEKVRVDLEVKRGNLVTLDEYRAEIARILKSLAGTLETLPDVLERSCGLQPSVVDALQNEIDRERAALADRLLADEPGAT